MLQVEMTGSVRVETGKGPMRQLRMKGITPAVVYGAGKENVSLQFETKELFQQLLKINRKNAIVTLNIDGSGSRNVLVQDVQTDPVKDTLVHVDFYEIDIDKNRVFEVPLNFVGNAKGCDLGGMLEVGLSKIALEAKPLDIPDQVDVVISELNIGDGIKVSDVVVPENVTVKTDLDKVCVSVVSAKKVAAETEADELEEIE